MATPSILIHSCKHTNPHKGEEKMNNFKKIREQALNKITGDVKQEKSREDKLVIEAVQAISELDDVFNLIVERTRNWYAYHYPELEKLVKEPSAYLIIIKEMKSKEAMITENLAPFIGEKQAKKIALKATNSMGADLQDKDLERITKMAELGLHVKQERDELTKYVETRMNEIAPNLCALAGGMLAARLIARTGSLEKLAEKPAGTIQVLGAEKALFAHLRKGTPPPKHGIIYHSPYVIQSPRKQRGKMARALAAKLAIAAREDFFEGKDISALLKQDLNKRIEEIRKSKK